MGGWSRRERRLRRYQKKSCLMCSVLKHFVPSMMMVPSSCRGGRCEMRSPGCRERLSQTLKCRPGHWPRPKGILDAPDNLRLRDRKAEPQAGEAEKLAERSQHHDGKLAAQPDRAAGRLDIGERFVDDQPAAALAQFTADVDY